MGGREGCQHRHARQHLARRQHSLDALAHGQHIIGHPEADAVAEKLPHGPARRGDRGLVQPIGGKPGAMRAGLAARKVGDSGNHRRTGLRWPMPVRAVVAPGVEAQRGHGGKAGDCPSGQIGCRERAADRLGYGEEPPCRLPRAGCPAGCPATCCLDRGRIGMGKRKKPACLGSHILEVEKARRCADQIEQIAVLAGGGIRPAARGTPAGFRACQTHEHRAAGSVSHIAHQPVVSGTMARGQVMAADCLGLPAKTDRQIGRVTMGHQRISCVLGHLPPPGSGPRTLGRGVFPGAESTNSRDSLDRIGSPSCPDPPLSLPTVSITAPRPGGTPSQPSVMAIPWSAGGSRVLGFKGTGRRQVPAVM